MQLLLLLIALLSFTPTAHAQGIQQLNQWKTGTNYIQPINNAYGLLVPGLATSTTGCLSVASNGWISASGSACGSGSGGGASFGQSWEISGGYLAPTSTITTRFPQGFISIGSSTIVGNATTTGTLGVGALYINGSRFTNLLGTGLTLSSSALTVSGLTTTQFASANISQWTNDSAYITKSSLSASPPIRYNSSTGAFDWTGLATTSQPTTAQLLTSNGGAGVYGTATSTLTASGPLTGSFVQVGSGGALGCTTAASGVAGCLSNTSFDTFNNKQATISVTWPITLSGATVGFNGLSTSTAAVISNIPYFTSANQFANVATGTITGSTGLSVTAGQSIIGSGLTITNTGVTSIALGGGLLESGSTGAVTLTAKVSTSSVPAVSNVAYWTSAGTPSLLSAVATSAVTFTAPLSGTTFNVLGSGGGAISITQSGTGADGYLSQSDFNTFNNKIATSALDLVRDWKVVSGDLVPTTTRGIIVAASSTIGSGALAGGLYIDGTATTTGISKILSAGSVTIPASAIYTGSSCAGGIYAIGAGSLGITNCTSGLTWNGTAFFPNTDSARDLGISATNRYRTVYALNASTTNVTSSGTASTTNLVISAAGTGATKCLQVDSAGLVSAFSAACSTGGSGEAFPFTPNATGFFNQVANSTSTQVHFGASPISLSASSSAQFVQASTTGLTLTNQWFTGITSNGLAVNSSGLVYSAASTTASTGLTYTSATNAFTVDLGTSITVGELASADFGDWTCNGSACTLDTAYATAARQLTVAGTAQQITSSAGAQDLSSDRTWTLSLPSYVKFPSSFSADLGSTTNATSTNITATTLASTTALRVSNVPAALLLTSAGGLVGAYGGAAACTNQFVTALSAIGASTCASINNDQWSGTDLAVTNGGTGLSTFGGTNRVLYTTAADTLASEAAFLYDQSVNRLTADYASTTAATIADAFFQTNANATSSITGFLSIGTAGRLIIPATANPSVGIAGQIAIDTTAASTSLRWSDTNGTEHAFFAAPSKSLVLSSSTLAYMGAYGSAGTTTIRLANFLRPTKIPTFFCKTDAGTAYVGFGTGTATTTNEANCSTAGVAVSPSAANTWTMRQDFFVEVGRTTGTPNTITITAELEDQAD